MKTPPTDEIIARLQLAQERLLDCGWSRGPVCTRRDPSTMCIMDAIAGRFVSDGELITRYAPTDPVANAALDAVAKVVNDTYQVNVNRVSLWEWNDYVARSLQDVIALIHETILYLKENMEAA